MKIIYSYSRCVVIANNLAAMHAHAQIIAKLTVSHSVQ